MRNLALVLAVFTWNAFAAEYPLSPNPSLTPGALCSTPTAFRYSEQIPYCERDVSGEMKQHVFSLYRNQLGFPMRGKREDYKVDHFIPLCAGGSNGLKNLWPQHVTLFTVTDPLEKLGCDKLAEGRITQAALIPLIKKAKLTPAQAPSVYKTLSSL